MTITQMTNPQPVTNRQFSTQTENLGTEPAMEIMAKAIQLEKQGRNILHLDVGEPNFDTPEHVKNAAKRALDSGYTHYGSPIGQIELREAIADHLSKRIGSAISPTNVVVTPGAKPVIGLTLMTLINPGDEVIYPNPGFPIFESLINYLGGVAVPMPLLEEHNFGADIDRLESSVSERTKVIILNSPNNPCGSVMPADDIKRIAQLAIKHNLVVLADEIYKDMYYDGNHFSIASILGMKERTVILDGFSKSQAMTGWRLGYGAFPDWMMETVTKFVINKYTCTSVFSQMAAITIFTGPQDYLTERLNELRARRDLIVQGLNSLKGVQCHTPGGAFYAFPNIVGTGMSSQELSKRALDEVGVAIVPGDSFGKYGAGYMRVSFGNSQDVIRRAVDKLTVLLN